MRNSMFLMEAIKLNSQRLISLNLAKNIILGLVLVLLFDFFLFPMPTLANEAVENAKNSQNLISLETFGETNISENIKDIADNIQEQSRLPQNINKKGQKSGSYLITAYNSETGQTDNSPCITANGFDLCKHGVEDTVAANFLPFGANIKMPDLFGDKVFVVRDRMNAHHTHRLDIWMVEKASAKKFGVKLAKIEVLE